MLSAGDLLWVPFTYSLQARFLGIFPQDLGLVLSGTILALKGLGYYIFRDSNMEKNMFRNGKNPKSASCVARRFLMYLLPLTLAI
jgi:delta14-sterol reductase